MTGDSGCSTPATSRAGAKSQPALPPRELSARRDVFRLVRRGEAPGPRKGARMTRLVSIITGVAVLAMQAAFLIALHFVLH